MEFFVIVCLAMIWIGWCYLLAMKMSKDFGLDIMEYALCILIGAVCTVATLFVMAALIEWPATVIGFSLTLYGCFRATRKGVETSSARRDR